MKETHRIIITNGTQVLLGLRKSGSTEGNKWHILGGKGDDGEESRTAAKREIFEEVGIDLEPDDLVCADIYQDWLTYYYYAFYSGELGIGDGENQEIRWFDFADVKELSLAFNHFTVLVDFLDKFDDRLG